MGSLLRTTTQILLITKRFRIYTLMTTFTAIFTILVGSLLSISASFCLYLRWYFWLGRLEISIQWLIGLQISQVLIVAHDLHWVNMRAGYRLIHLNCWYRSSQWHLQWIIVWLYRHLLSIKRLVLRRLRSKDIGCDALVQRWCNLICQFDHWLATMSHICRPCRNLLETI